MLWYLLDVTYRHLYQSEKYSPTLRWSSTSETVPENPPHPGLTVFKNKSGRKVERVKKYFQKNFRENDLNIVIKCNLKIVDYLDVTFNLFNNTYKPFSKPNNEINYVHKESNHPTSIIKQVLFQSSHVYQVFPQVKKKFNESMPTYEKALKKSGYDYRLKYQKNSLTTTSKQQRKRK